jgi:hypothetical protein
MHVAVCDSPEAILAAMEVPKSVHQVSICEMAGTAAERLRTTPDSAYVGGPARDPFLQSLATIRNCLCDRIQAGSETAYGKIARELGLMPWLLELVNNIGSARTQDYLRDAIGFPLERDSAKDSGR